MHRRLILAWLAVCWFGFVLPQEGSIEQTRLTAQSKYLTAKQAALLGELDDALVQFQNLLESDPHNATLHFELGRLYQAQENTRAAISSLEKAWQLDPLEAYGYYLTSVYESAGQYQDAAQLYSQLIDMQPREISYYVQQAELWRKAGEMDKAVRTYDQLERKVGPSPLVNQNRHALYLQMGDQRKAERELKQLIQAYPQRMAYRHLLAGYYQAQGQTGKLRDTYREILQIEPSDVRARLALGSDAPATASGQHELMAVVSDPAVELDLKIGQLLEQVQAAAEKPLPEAEKVQLQTLLDELVRVHPDQAKALAIRADFLAVSGRDADAADAYAATLELQDNIYAVWAQYFDVLYRDQQLARLRRDGQQALDIFPNRPQLYLYLALAEAGRSNWGGARSLLAEAGMMSRGLEAVRQQVEATRHLLDQLEEPASAQTEQVLQDPFGRLLAALAAHQKGRHQAAVDLLLPHTHDRLTNALWLETLGRALEAVNRNDEAQLYLQRARQASSL